MEITSISFYPNDENTFSMKKITKVSIVLNDLLMIKDIRVIQGKFGIFVSWPRTGKESLVIPITAKFNDKISHEILVAWKAFELANIEGVRS